MRRAIENLILLLALCSSTLHAQIWGGIWISSTSFGVGTSCTDNQVNAEAMCEVTVECTSPPNSESGFSFGGDINDRCDNQPVNNLVTVGEIDSITEHAYVHSEGMAWHRTIFTGVSTSDCNGNFKIISVYRDQYGCAPPPPPPPPPPPTCHCNQCTGVCTPAGCSCPIAIDLLGEGMHFTSLPGGVLFDFNGDGKPLSMSWTDPGYHNAWLALDRNHNGTIDNAQELFAYVTEPQMSSPDGKRSGWLALAVYDQPEYGGNGDGVIDAKDAIYSQLLLWIDENHDGISQPEELHHLQEVGVTKIELDYKKNKSYQDAFGNTFKFESFVTVGQWKRQAWDVVLNASDAPFSSGPQPDVYCSLTPRHSPTWDLELDADWDAPPSAFALCALIAK